MVASSYWSASVLPRVTICGVLLENALPMLARHLLAELKAEHDQLIERVDRFECTIVENSDDQHFLTTTVGISSQAVALVRGIGVDVSSFKPAPETLKSVPTVTMVSRMLWPKGVAELVEAARMLQQRGRPVRVQLVGVPDPSSRVSIPERQLLEWQAEGTIEWLGYREDVADIWEHSNIAILPSGHHPALIYRGAIGGLPGRG